MALPKELMSDRMTNDTLGVDIDNRVADLEATLCDIFGFTIDTNITESPFSCDNSGRITKTIIRQVGAGPVGWRYRDSTSGKEARLVLDGTDVKVDENTGTEGSPTWTNRATMALATGVWAFAGASFTAIPTGPASSPTTDNQLSRKKYVDDQIIALDAAIDTLLEGKVNDTGDESVAGVKTFTSFPVTPSSAPTTDYQAANKKYVDDKTASINTSFALLQNRQTAGTHGGGTSAGAWANVPLNVEQEDANNIVDASALPAFSLGAGTYRIEATCPIIASGPTATRLYNVTDATVTIEGSACDTAGSTEYANTDSIIIGTFTIVGTKQFRIEYRCTVGWSSKGHGKATGFQTEVYAQVKIYKLA